jgi:uncharacterized membrane protein YbhN (UPF0104 family)
MHDEPEKASPPDGPTPREPWSKLGRRVAVGVLLGLVVYAGMLLWGDLGGITAALRELDLRVPLAACALSFANYCVRFPRWQRYLALVEASVPRRTSFLIYLAGLALTVSPGKMGEALKSWLVRSVQGAPLARTAPIVLAERFTDLTGFLVLIAIGSATGDYAWVTYAAGGLAALLLALVSSRRAEVFVVELVSRLPVVAPIAPRLAVAASSTRVLLAPRELVSATILATLGWGLECVGAWLVVDALAPGAATLLEVTYAFALAAVAGALAIVLPGGLGVTDGLLGALLQRPMLALGYAADVARTKAISATLVIRLCTLWFAMAVGLVALALFRRLHPRPTQS